jgi:hypothetical protein
MNGDVLSAIASFGDIDTRLAFGPEIAPQKLRRNTAFDHRLSAIYRLRSTCRDTSMWHWYKVVRTWEHIARWWDGPMYTGVLHNWQQIDYQLAPTSACPGCGVHVSNLRISSSVPVCALCDHVLQPYWCNPANLEFARYFLRDVEVPIVQEYLRGGDVMKI